MPKACASNGLRALSLSEGDGCVERVVLQRMRLGDGRRRWTPLGRAGSRQQIPPRGGHGRLRDRTSSAGRARRLDRRAAVRARGRRGRRGDRRHRRPLCLRRRRRRQRRRRASSRPWPRESAQHARSRRRCARTDRDPLARTGGAGREDRIADPRARPAPPGQERPVVPGVRARAARRTGPRVHALLGHRSAPPRLHRGARSRGRPRRLAARGAHRPRRSGSRHAGARQHRRGSSRSPERRFAPFLRRALRPPTARASRTSRCSAPSPPRSASRSLEALQDAIVDTLGRKSSHETLRAAAAEGFRWQS